MNSIALLAPTFAAPFQARIYSELALHCDQSNQITCRPVTDDPDRQTSVLERVIVGRPSAIIAISVRPSDAMVRLAQSAKIRIVLIDEEASGCSSVSSSNELGGLLAGTHLVERGCRRIGVISGAITGPGSRNAADRVAGLREALERSEARIVSHEQVIHYSSIEGEDMAADMPLSDLDGVFIAAGDQCATGFLRSAATNGVQIPHQLKVIGYDDLPIAEIVRPNLTTIRQPFMEMADAAFRLATKERSRPPQKIELKSQLVVREST